MSILYLGLCRPMPFRWATSSCMRVMVCWSTALLVVRECVCVCCQRAESNRGYPNFGRVCFRNTSSALPLRRLCACVEENCATVLPDACESPSRRGEERAPRPAPFSAGFTAALRNVLG